MTESNVNIVRVRNALDEPFGQQKLALHLDLELVLQIGDGFHEHARDDIAGANEAFGSEYAGEAVVRRDFLIKAQEDYLLPGLLALLTAR